MKAQTQKDGGLRPLSPLPLHEQAYIALRDELAAGRLRPGEALTVRGIAAQLDISVTPVREALQRLIAEGALELAPNRSVQVPVMTRELYFEITEIRVRLETLAGVSAISACGKSLISELENLSVVMREAIDEERFSDYLIANQHFHFSIYEAAGLSYLQQLIGLCWLRVGPWFNMLAKEGRFVSSANDKHEQIIRSLHDGAKDALAAAIESDIRDAYHLLVDQLESPQEREL